MKLLVCGGRNYADRMQLGHALDMLYSTDPITIVIQGGAPGADTLAAIWAMQRGIHCAEVKAMWGKLGRRAGPMRNEAMLTLRPDLVLAFPGGIGTDGMCKLASDAGIRVIRAG